MYITTLTPCKRLSGYLIKTCRKQVQGCQNASVRAQAILLHDIFVVHLQQAIANASSCTCIASAYLAIRLALLYRISYVYVCTIWDFSHSRIQVDNIAWGVSGVQV